MKRRTRLCACETLESRAMLSTAASDPPPALGVAALSSADDYAPLQDATGTTYSGGVTVTDTEIITPTDVIPRFAAEPTISAIRTGAWSDPRVWSEGRVPTANDRVLIPQDTGVVYTIQSDARLDAVEVGGYLIFWPMSDTRMVVGTLTVMPTGTLQIGKATQPISPQVTAEIVIADKALDFENDPSQFGTGLISLGKVTIHGAVLNQTWTRLSIEPKAGDTVLVVSQPDPTWQAGDTLVLPDTRQVPTSQTQQFESGELPPHWEKVTIDRVVGDQVFLTQPLEFDHLGARDADGTVKLLPHVAILDRNVIIRSENPDGTRGHVLSTARADVDIRYARFQDLGRTDAFRSLDNTTFDDAGNVTHIGTNQIARYAVHFHHVIGPENPTNTGYQFELVGNTVDGARKWAVTVHDSSYGLVNQNVVYDAQGAGFVTEDGSEIENVFRDNIAIRIVGTHFDGYSGTQEGDYGRGGSGFWFRRGGNLVAGNVAADSSYAGFVFSGYFNTGTVRLPLFRGAMKHTDGQGYAAELNPATFFLNNEAYGLMTNGLWAAYIAGHNLLPDQPRTAVLGFRVWNVLSAGIRMFHTSNVTIAYSTFYGDVTAQDRNDSGTSGLHLATVENRDVVINNSRIEGMRFGIIAPRRDASQPGHDRPTLIQNTWLKNYINILVAPAWDYGPGDNTALIVRNVKFDLLAELPAGPADPSTINPPANIQMRYGTPLSDLTKRVVVKVYNYNRVSGDDFQVYFREQSGSYIVPQTDPALLNGLASGTIGAPEAGLSNTLSWERYGIAIGGKPVDYPASRGEIDGLVGPISDSSATAPRVVIVTPWDGAIVGAEPPVNVRYNVNGQLPDTTGLGFSELLDKGQWVFFSLDDSLGFTNFINGGLYNLTPGWHTLRAWIGDFGRNEVPGTIGSSVTFFVPVATSSSSGEITDPRSAAQGNGTIIDAAEYDAIASGLALQGSAYLEANPRSAVGATVGSPNVPPVPVASISPRVRTRQAMRQTNGYGDATDDTPHDHLLGDKLLSELAEDIVAAGPHLGGS